MLRCPPPRCIVTFAFLLLALIAALFMPAPVLSHTIPGQTPHGNDCEHQTDETPPYDFCHAPAFPMTDLTINLDGAMELDGATDADHRQRTNVTMIYDLRNANPNLDPPPFSIVSR